MSGALSRQRSRPVLLFVASLLAVAAIILLSGCGTSSTPTTPITPSPSSASSSTTGVSPAAAEPVMTTSPWAVSWPSPEASEAAESAISAWPPGIEVLVLSTGYELYVVGHDGIRWSQEMQPRPESTTSRHRPRRSTVWPSAQTNSSSPTSIMRRRSWFARSVTVPRSVASRIRLKVRPNCGACPRTVTWLSLSQRLRRYRRGRPATACREGSRSWTCEAGRRRSSSRSRTSSRSGPLSDPKAQFTLYSLDWLSNESLVVSYVGWQQEAYAYDIHTNVMERIPGMTMVSAVGDRRHGLWVGG